jgi:hypothetical protein
MGGKNESDTWYQMLQRDVRGRRLKESLVII